MTQVFFDNSVFVIGNITRNSEKIVLSLPCDQKSRAFMKAFDLIFNSLVIPDNPKPVDIAFSAYTHKHWVLGLMWLAKDYFKLWKATDPPFCKPEVKAYESFGNELIALSNLCYQTLDYVPELSTDTPLNFAGRVILEKKDLDMIRSHQYQGVKGKSYWNKLDAEGLAKLKDWINPYSPKDAPLMFNLINAAISFCNPNCGVESKQLRKKRTRYCQRAWTPYLNALRERNKNEREGIDLGKGQQVKFVTPEIKGDAVVAPSPKKGGKDFVTICKPRPKNLSGRGRKPEAKFKITLIQQASQRLESDF